MIFDLGYGLSAAAYSLLVLMLLTVRNAGLARHLLLFATLSTVVWSLIHVSYVQVELGQENLLKFDAARQWVWMLFIAACLRNQFSSFTTFISRPITLAIMLLPSAALIFAALELLPATWQFSLLTVNALQSLVLLEVVYRQADKEKWAFKPLVLFLGAINLFDFVTYANATMVNQLSWNFFAARGYIFVALMPFLVLAIRRIKHWGIDIFVSREVVLHSTLLLVAGVYLMIMATLGYVVKYLGGSWSLPLQMALGLVSLALLLSLFMSHQFRNTIKVFITKHFYANQYDYRVEWVKLTKRLSKGEQDLPHVYETALDAYLQGVGYAQGCLYKINSNRRDASLVARVDGDVEVDHQALQEKLSYIIEFCKESAWVVDFDELKTKPDLYESLPKRELFMRGFSYQLAVPIFQHDALWGIVFMKALEPDKRSLNWELRDYLSALTDQIANYIFHAESSQALAENAQFAAFNRMSAFVVHDLKNVLAQINLILSNAQQHKDNPEFIADTFETLEYTKERMDKMLKQLTNKKVEAKQGLKFTDITLELEKVIKQKCAGLKPIPELEVDESVSEAIGLKIDAEKFSNVMYHLISNAQQATNESGSVKVLVGMENEFALIRIIDDGEGMTEEFVNHRLFKPFDTTKGNAGMGIGAYDAKQFVQECGGSIQVNSEVGSGSEFIVRLPVEAKE
uniref:XrtA/PEP-CTERM system histidine kinase PrsK n=1 Tax=Ningiella ruwaisensis TaxID=2364274 RepID=UPI00109FBAA5|nr:XrtA/PEP-CTERM system histidine kinase PrsK [Ningiella ruwaisensis]